MHDAFMRTIVANPDDDAPRLVYADWLDETEDKANADRAEFIRLQIQLETLPADAPQRPMLVKREQALLKKYAKKWAQPFREIVGWWAFRRGFIDSAVVYTEGMAGTFTPQFRALVEGTPLRELVLFQQTDDFECLLPAAPLMKRLRSFVVRGGFLYSGGHVLRTLFESKHLSGLTRLELEGARSHSFFRPRTLSGILQSPVLANLTDLSLSDYLTDLEPTVLRTVARSRSLRNLTRLSLEGTHFHPELLHRILHAPYAKNLEVLELRGCYFNRATWKELLSPKVLPALKRLLLGGVLVTGIDLDDSKEQAAPLLKRVRSRFGADIVDIAQQWREYPYRPWFYSWWDKTGPPAS